MPALYLATNKAAGDECSSTYEGRHVTVEESYLVHPYRTSGLVQKGDPCLVGNNIVGVAMSSATVATDYIAIDTEGIWFLNVIGSVSDGTSDGIAKQLVTGDPVYFQVTPGSDTYLLSGEQDPSKFRFFGYLLGTVTAHVSTPTLVAVKVHNAPMPEAGRLHFGSGSTVAGNMLLEGDGALRRSRLLEACLAPASIMLAGEQIHGFNIRIVDNVISTGGEITAGELKAVRDEATEATVTSATALKLNVDNKKGGVAPYARGLDIMMEGAGTAPAIRAAISINSGGTEGTLEAWFEARSATACGLDADATAIGDRTFQIPILIGGVRYAIPVIAWT